MTADARSVAVDGRELGRRGEATRRRLLDATAELLRDHGVRDLRVVDITRSVGSSPATFYQYFRDAPDAVLALAVEVGEDVAPLGEALGADWSGEDGFAAASAFVEGFLTYWDEHRAILRTRNLAAQEGDERFRVARNTALRPLVEGIAVRVAQGQEAGRVAPELSPAAAAAALVAMLERMAAFHTDLEDLGVERGDLVETTARILYDTVTGTAARA